MSDGLDGILSALAATDESTAKRETRAKRVAKERVAETTTEAFNRIRLMKLSEDERLIVDDVERLAASGQITLAAGKLSKKAVFEAWKSWNVQERERLKLKVVAERPDNYWIVTDETTLARLERMLADEPITAWDTESTGLDVFLDKIVGWSVYLPNADIAAYVPFAHETGQTQVSPARALAVAKRYLENGDNRTIWHNYVYDGHMFANHGITVENPYYDTMSAAKLLNEHEPHKLKLLHAKYVKGGVDDAVTFEDLFDDFVIYDKDIVLAGVYAAGDAHKTFQLYNWQLPFINERDRLKVVWWEVEQPLLNVTLALERTGFCIDLERLESLKTEFQPQMEIAEVDLIRGFAIDADFIAKMSEKLGRNETEFNVNSNDHLTYLIYDVCGIPDDYGKRFKKALRSTAAEVVDAITESEPLLEPLLRYRSLKKLLSTYVEKIPKALEPTTGRLHSRFANLTGEGGAKTGAATGRYTSSEYVSAKHSRTGEKRGTNLQNVMSKGLGGEVRKCFVAAPDHIFIFADASQAEPRVMAHILATEYGDDSLKRIYEDGLDLYTTWAQQTFGLAVEFCVDKAYDPTGRFKPRALMKTGFLAYLYGQSAKSFATKMSVSLDVAEAFFTGMSETSPGLERFRDDTVRLLSRAGNVAYAEDLFGRKRRFPDYRRNKADLAKFDGKNRWKLSAADKERRNELWRKVAGDERAAINHRIQASSASMLKLTMIEVYRWCRLNGFEMNATIHDELVVSVPLMKLTPDVISRMNDLMTTTVKLCVPQKSDVTLAYRWSADISPDVFEWATLQEIEVAV